MASGQSLSDSLPSNPTFVRHDSKYDCLHCGEVLKEAMQTSCGHRICERCIPALFHGNIEPVMCPAREEDCLPQTKSDITPDPSGRREIRNLNVFCEYKDFGCDNTLKWKDLAEHKLRCKFQPLECPNKAFGCDVVKPRDLLEEHVKKECEFRQVQCQYCNNLIPWKRLQKHIDDECLVVQLVCPYNCGSEPMARAEINNIEGSRATAKYRDCQ